MPLVNLRHNLCTTLEFTGKFRHLWPSIEVLKLNFDAPLQRRLYRFDKAVCTIEDERCRLE